MKDKLEKVYGKPVLKNEGKISRIIGTVSGGDAGDVPPPPDTSGSLG